MKLGKFIVLEGLDGSGKTKAAKYIKKILKKKGIMKIKNVHEPGSTLIAEKIRKIIKENQNKEKIYYKTEILLMYAARIQLINKIIKPSLKKGKWIIGDRHNLSTLAYQGGKNGIHQNFILKLKKKFFKKFEPNLTIFLDVKPKIGIKRFLKRNKIDRIESKKEKFFLEVRNNYFKIIKLFKNIIIINANKKIENVKKNIKKNIYKWLNTI